MSLLSEAYNSKVLWITEISVTAFFFLFFCNILSEVDVL